MFRTPKNEQDFKLMVQELMEELTPLTNKAILNSVRLRCELYFIVAEHMNYHNNLKPTRSLESYYHDKNIERTWSAEKSADELLFLCAGLLPSVEIKLSPVHEGWEVEVTSCNRALTSGETVGEALVKAILAFVLMGDEIDFLTDNDQRRLT